MTTTTTKLRTDRQDGILTLTLDGPDTRNSIGPDLYLAVEAAILDAERDDAVGAIVLTGANGYFSSGGNVRALKASRSSTLSAATGNTDKLNAMILAIAACSKPVVAAVEGGAAGAGFSLCLSCDLIVAAEDARFVAAYVRVGLTPDGGATYFFARALPRQLANELCLLGRPVTADRLQAAGLVNSCHSPGNALSEATALARALADGPRMALARIKELVANGANTELATQLDREARSINLARFSEEAAEGLSAFMENRPARYRLSYS